MSDIDSDIQFTAYLYDLEASWTENNDNYPDIIVRIFTFVFWPTLAKIFQTVTEILVCLIKMWTSRSMGTDLPAVSSQGPHGAKSTVFIVRTQNGGKESDMDDGVWGPFEINSQLGT